MSGIAGLINILAYEAELLDVRIGLRTGEGRVCHNHPNSLCSYQTYASRYALSCHPSMSKSSH